MADLRTSIVIDLAGNLTRNAQRYGGALNEFSRRGQRDLTRLERSARSLGRGLDTVAGRYTGAIAGVAATYAGTRAVIQAGQLDRQLIRVQQTAGSTRAMAAALRKELFAMSEQTGQSVDSLLQGFNGLIQAGLSWEQSLATIQAINPAMAVTDAQAQVLASSLTVAAEAFDFDLSQPGLAVELLDQMRVAGNQGKAELENLSSIFARVGVNAKAANLSFVDTLGFIEALSQSEDNPERLATLADSTLRIFTNQRYLQNAADATGVSFYDAEGQRRAAFDVLDDIAAKYQQLSTDIDRDRALASAFGEADQDTIRGLRMLLSGGTLETARKFSAELESASGTVARELNEALGNSVDQVARLKETLRGAADEFAKPINDAVADAVKYLLDERGLSGKEILGGSAVAGIAGLGLLKGGGKLLGNLGAGVAAGKALEEFAGVQPVYVVNMPGGFGGLPGVGGGKASLGRNARIFSRARTSAALLGGTRLSQLGMLGASAVGTAGLAVAGAGAAGYGIGTLINKGLIEGTSFGDAIGEGIAKTLAFFGNDDARAAVAAQEGYERMMRGEVRVKIETEKGVVARTEQARSDNDALGLEVETEAGMAAAGAW